MRAEHLILGMAIVGILVVGLIPLGYSTEWTSNNLEKGTFSITIPDLPHDSDLFDYRLNFTSNDNYKKIAFIQIVSNYLGTSHVAPEYTSNSLNDVKFVKKYDKPKKIKYAYHPDPLIPTYKNEEFDRTWMVDVRFQSKTPIYDSNRAPDTIKNSKSNSNNSQYTSNFARMANFETPAYIDKVILKRDLFSWGWEQIKDRYDRHQEEANNDKISERHEKGPATIKHDKQEYLNSAENFQRAKWYGALYETVVVALDGNNVTPLASVTWGFESKYNGHPLESCDPEFQNEPTMTFDNTIDAWNSDLYIPKTLQHSEKHRLPIIISQDQNYIDFEHYEC